MDAAGSTSSTMLPYSMLTALAADTALSTSIGIFLLFSLVGTGIMFLLSAFDRFKPGPGSVHLVEREGCKWLVYDKVTAH